MPQLNPNPWFLTMLATWAIFSLIIQPKLLPFIPTDHPSSKTNIIDKSIPWTWPWT